MGSTVDSLRRDGHRKAAVRTAGAVILSIVLCGCGARTTSSTDGIPPSRMSVEKVQEVVDGDADTILPLIPSQYSITPIVSRPASGSGFIVRLSWTYAPPPSGMNPVTSRWSAQWAIQMYSGSDSDNLSRVQLPNQDYFNLQERLEWFTPNPIANGYFVLEFLASIQDLVNSRQVSGTLRLARIKLDLRGVQ